MPIAAARGQINAHFNQGAGIIHYTGHGSPSSFSSQGLLRNSDVNGLNNQNRPIMLALSCLVGRFEAPTVDSLGEVMLRRNKGGAVAVWGPSAQSQHHAAEALGDAFYQQILEEGSGTLGPAALRARRTLSDNFMTAGTFATYNLLGDPALKIGGIVGGHEEDAHFAQWRWERFSPDQLSDTQLSGAESDANGNGWNNLLEYAFGGNPVEGDLIHVPLRGLRWDGPAGGYVVQWHQRRLAPDLTYRLAASTDLKSWTPEPDGVEILDILPVPGQVMERVTARIPSEHTRLFIRLEVIAR